MDATTLTDRYVDAAMRTVPEKQRDDLAAELHASIADQVDARVEAGEPPNVAEHAVLTDLGDPEKLAAGYTGRQLYLLSPRYYLDWWRLLKVLLWSVIPSVGAAVTLGQILAGASAGTVIGTVWVTMLTVALHLVVWTTLVFVILDRTEATVTTAWTVERLPEPKQSGATFGDMLATIIMMGVLAGLIVWDLWLGYVPRQRLSLLNPQLWPTAILILFVLMALVAALAVVVHVQGRWTLRTATAQAVLAVGSVVALAYNGGQLLNPAFFLAVIPDDPADVQRILTILAWFFIAGSALWSIIDAFLKARRARR